ncbi:DUF4845 domain-containing protein [Amantichitinum ursilacus]|uniref:DUF4845 domain-containing protein n=1 Tax=Amantichitinum ursilacus TaxID=857265 RepID=A0A0N0GNX6_9NEIS|nr:DUF4845 domain-containing protein [Amantichitinum ursilacus]KPC52983.1 hypothetical protein WG78_10850 [Amantichitinum ursilacus]
MRKQQGLSFFGFIIVAVFVAAVAVTFFKVIPAYVEYFNIKKTIKTIAKEGAGQPPAEVRKSFSRHAQIDDIESVQATDLQIQQTGGVMNVSVSYQRTVPLVANISLLFNFDIYENSGAQVGP